MIKSSLIFLFLSGVILQAPDFTYQPPEIIQRLMPLSVSGNRRASAFIDTILIHFSSNVIAKPTNPYVPEDIISIFQTYGVSSHYLIDREGNIYQLVDESRAAYHAGSGMVPGRPERTNNLNHYSVGIEFLGMGSQSEMSIFMSASAYNQLNPEFIGYTEAQFESGKRLVEDIIRRNPAIARDRVHVLAHDEYAPDRKTDPGSLFDWAKIGFPEPPPWEK